jgi:cytidine deaminase
MTDESEKKLWVPKAEDIEVQARYIKMWTDLLTWPVLRGLALEAADVRHNAYAPNSKYKVGAVILTGSGKKYKGANVERIGQSETNHAEEVAASNFAIYGQTDGGIRVVAISHTEKGPPCGRCRQILIQHCDNTLIVVADEKGEIQLVTSLLALLPLPFKSLES